jgi:hypothetical protein
MIEQQYGSGINEMNQCLVQIRLYLFFHVFLYRGTEKIFFLFIREALQ